ncbi:unnamed protein product [Kuraishia capsulata CBS 1993]|uniref:Glycosyltransferase family 32 protein n=1 Tax=Kuraishia capsulata CBS 1993 TaxID=1382522 RepID=W6MRZ1_9ASCO|nr:uncharacterized protein KUCA_T00005145001 [Kuraishia capsulata CBS 1993]CDK29158.1 unnamed protein product [Kuraishia capsulata CBS 1993]
MDYNELQYGKPPRWWNHWRLQFKNNRFGTFVKQLVLFILGIYALSAIWTASSSVTASTASLYNSDTSNPSDFKSFGKDLQARFNHLPVSSTGLRERLVYYHPYMPERPISDKVWQTWKVGMDNVKFPSKFKSFSESWTTVNPTYNHMIVPDDAVPDMIAQMYATTPEISKTFHLLPSPIMKADFFRYLVLFARGGVYSDMDTVALKPISEWPLFNASLLGVDSSQVDVTRRLTPIGLAVGIEADPDRPDWSDWYARRLQFCQWTLQAKKGHPMLRELIIRIVETTARRLAEGTLQKVEGKDKGGDVMNWTGPAVFTDTLFDYVNNVVSEGRTRDGTGIGSTYHNEHKLYEREKLKEAATVSSSKDRMVTWQSFTGLEEPKAIDDVLVMPITCFSPGVGQMGSQRETHWLALVKHMFEGSWKPEKERRIGKKGK